MFTLLVGLIGSSSRSNKKQVQMHENHELILS